MIVLLEIKKKPPIGGFLNMFDKKIAYAKLALKKVFLWKNKK